MQGSAIATWLIVLAMACSDRGEPRPQLVLVVDTDAPIAGQLEGDGSISRDAAMDTLRVDVVDRSNGDVTELETFAVSSLEDWPISFGIAPPKSGSSPRLRLRLFRANNARPAVVRGEPVLEPTPAVSIDRLVDVHFPDQGIARRRIELSFACIGTSPTFGMDARTCLDAARQDASPGEGVEVETRARPTRVGSTPLAREVPCNGEPEGTICVPGGFAFLGDLDLFGESALSEDARPLRPVLISPFALDRTERTVGQLRELLSKHPEIPAPRQQDGTPLTHGCHWRGLNDSSADDLPINCVSPESAQAVCEALGGSLPSEARWEFAARGRGRRYTLPWGTSNTECCVASHSRVAPSTGKTPVCGQKESAEPVASHLPNDDCAGAGDVSIDGVVDLGGSMSELMLDRLAGYDAPCWRVGGRLRDPICAADVSARVERGGAWSRGAGFMFSATRRSYSVALGSGFRCAFEVAP
jgi:formylglycine-generating enzyme required for sulfatase activity